MIFVSVFASNKEHNAGGVHVSDVCPCSLEPESGSNGVGHCVDKLTKFQMVVGDPSEDEHGSRM